MTTEFDSFISYASENERIASEIAGALKSRGFHVWYAPDELQLGSSLLKSIEAGMSRSKVGILLLSRSYLNKNWPKAEADVLLRRFVETNNQIYPIWLDVSKEEVENFSPVLAGIVAAKISGGLPDVVEKIAKALAKNAPNSLVFPSYESPSSRFLNGRGEANIIGSRGGATTLWELLLHMQPEGYPIYIEGQLYTQQDLIFRAAQLIRQIPDTVRGFVGQDGLERIERLCLAQGFNPANFE